MIYQDPPLHFYRRPKLYGILLIWINNDREYLALPQSLEIRRWFSDVAIDSPNFRIINIERCLKNSRMHAQAYYPQELEQMWPPTDCYHNEEQEIETSLAILAIIHQKKKEGWISWFLQAKLRKWVLSSATIVLHDLADAIFLAINL